MAKRTWIGRAAPVRQVTTFTVGGSVAAANTFTVTMNTRAVTYTAGSGETTTTVAAALLAAIQACGYPEFDEVTWSSSAAVVTATGAEDGTYFTATSSTSGSGSPTLAASTTTAATGPNYWANANNWLESAVPVTGDDVVVGDGPPILFDLDQSAVTLASLTVTQAFPAENAIGRPIQNEADYFEYRKTRLQVSATVCTIDTRSRRIRLDLGADPSTVTVNDTGTAAAGQFAVDLICDDVATVVRVNRGQVGIAPNANEVSTLASVRAAYRERTDSDVVLEVGAGVTLVTFEQTGGEAVLRCAATTVTREAGRLTRFGSGAITTLDNRGGRVEDYGTGTITTLQQAGVYNRRGLAALTVTDMNLYGGSSTSDPNGTITHTNAVQYVKCGPPAAPGDTAYAAPSAVAWWNFGYARKLTPVDV